MARTKNRSNRSKNSSGKGSKGPKVAITRNESERNVGSGIFLRLNDDEKFTAYSLFDPDPSAEDNPGYVEYGEHWDNTNSRFVPCWGIKKGCIYCKAGQQASQRALGAFLVTSINGEELEEPEIRLFRMNWTMIQEWGDTLDEDGSTLGQKIRIKCISRSDGDYTTKFFDKDRLSKKDLKAATADIPDIEQQLQNNLNRALEALRVSSVLEDDDDEDEDDEDIEDEEEEEAPKSRKTRSRNKKAKDEDDEDEDEDDDDEDDEDEDDEDENDDDEEDEEDSEEEDDDEESEDDDDEDEDEDEDESESLDGDYTVVSASENEMTISLKELDSDLYLDQSIVSEIDFDELKKGDKIHVEAVQDEDEDWVATKVEKLQAKRGRGRPKGSKNKPKSKKGGSKKK